jgi:hypothetical protein
VANVTEGFDSLIAGASEVLDRIVCVFDRWYVFDLTPFLNNSYLFMADKIDWEYTNLTTVDLGATGGLVPGWSNRKKNDHDHFS